MFTPRSLLAGAIVLGFAGIANAVPTMSIGFQYVNAFTGLTSGATNAPTENGFASTDPGYITVDHSGTFRYRFNVLLTLSDPTAGTATALAPGMDLSSLNFSVDLAGQNGGTITPKASAPYSGKTGTYLPDTTDPGTTANVFGNNADAATPDDLQAILVSTTSAKIAMDRHPGESPRPDPAWAAAGEGDDLLGYPTLLGTIDIIWNGQGNATITSDVSETFLALFMNNQTGTGTATAAPNAVFNPQTVTLGGSVPEPVSLGLLGVAALAMARRRRV